MRNRSLKTLSGKTYRYSSDVIHKGYNLLNVENIHKLQCVFFVFGESKCLVGYISKLYKSLQSRGLGLLGLRVSVLRILLLLGENLQTLASMTERD